MSTIEKNLGIVPTVCEFAKFQQCLYSLNNDALYTHNGIKATTQFLVPFGARAQIQLQHQFIKAVDRKLFEYAERLASDIHQLNHALNELAITRDVAQYIADNTPYRV
jgi:hypothetical protein